MRKDLAVSRRRFLRIAGGATLAAGLPSSAFASEFHWRGVVFGAEASLSLRDFARKDAEEITKRCLREAARLEKIFSLFIPHSAIRQLNAKGTLEDAPAELLEVLSFAQTISRQTDAAFDVSIQPLWRYLFYTEPSKLQAAKVEELKRLVDYRAIEVDADRVSFGRPGMEISLNGIAQGYITDRIAGLLTSLGVQNVLVDFGEFRALGQSKTRGPWQVGIRVPGSKEASAVLPLQEQALATSSLFGLQNSPEFQHIFSTSLLPTSAATPQPEIALGTVSVRAKKAVQADALSTALLLLEPRKHSALLRSYPQAEIVYAS